MDRAARCSPGGGLPARRNHLDLAFTSLNATM